MLQGFRILFLLSSVLILVESFCHVGVFLQNEKDDFRETQLTKSNESQCSLSIEYAVDVDVCVFSRLKGIAAVDTTNCDKSGCRLEKDTTTKKIICCCLEDKCNGQKDLIRRDLTLFQEKLEDKPKTNALLLYELDCLMEYFEVEKPSRSAIRDFFTDPLYLSIFIFGCIIAFVAVLAIWWLCFKTKKERKTSDDEETTSFESDKGMTTAE